LNRWLSLKSIGALILALVVAFGVGWLAGASGRAAIEQQLVASEERANFAQARALIGDGRVSLFLVNFGDASRRFEEARGVVERMQTKLRELGQAERAGRLEIALSHLKDAQRLAASLDSSAQGAAAEALRALGS
jgi:hypothetical protein